MFSRLYLQISGVPFQGVEVEEGGKSERKVEQMGFSFLQNLRKCLFIYFIY